MNIYQKLLNIQKGISGLGKDGKAYGYDYVTGSKVLKEIRPLMDKEGLLLKQEVINVENSRQDYTVKNNTIKSEILSKVLMKFTWVDCETGEKDENLFAANGQNDWEKGLGSALTYAERYFLLKFFHIATDEDDIDNPARKEKQIAKAKALQDIISNVQVNEIQKATSVNELKTIWENHIELQGNDEFKAVVSAAKMRLAATQSNNTTN